MAVLASLLSVLALGASVVTAQNSTQNNTAPIVNLGYAQYQGISNSTFNSNVYFGIRYAAPPVGELRFRAPVDIERQNNYRPSTPIDATQWGPECFQGSPDWSVTNSTPSPQPGSEDCLLLDVITPQQPASTGLPVMVQIHGGGYAAGNSHSYPGWALVNQSQGNIIYVSIQYRLNAFGFLSSAEVRDNGSPNAGLLDMRAALNWVQRNIRAFGGDPSKVTIIGGSAGGGAVMNQMILYGGEANPPFRAVISEYPWFQPYHNNTLLEAQYRELLTAANCSDIECLRSIDSRSLDLASQAVLVSGYTAIPREYGYGDFFWGPSVDGEIIRDLPSNEFKQGHFSKVSLLVDHDGYEGYAFSNRSQTTMSQETTDLQQVFPYAKDSFFKRLYEIYPMSDFNSTLFQRQAIFGDFIIDCPTYYMATATADYGLPTYKLLFDAGSELHGATVPFLFGTGALQGNNATLAYIMKDWFLSFAIDQDPNTRSFTNVSKPYWPSYLGNNGVSNSGNSTTGGNVGPYDFNTMDVNYTMIGNTPDADASARCDFFHGQSYVVRN